MHICYKCGKEIFKYYIIIAGDYMTKYYDLAKDNKEIAIKKLEI